MQTPLTEEQAKRVGEAFATFAELGLLSVDLNNHVTFNTPPKAAAAVGVAPSAARTEHVDARSRVFIPGGEVVVPCAREAKLPAMNAAMVFDELGWREAKDGETPTGWFAGGSGDTEIRVKLRNTAPPYDDSRGDDAIYAWLRSHDECIGLVNARVGKLEAKLASTEVVEFSEEKLKARAFDLLQQEFFPSAEQYSIGKRAQLMRDKMNGQVTGLDLARLTAMAKIEKHLFPNSSCTAESATITANQVCRLLPFDMGFGG